MTRLCSECDKPHHARGYCMTHYQRYRCRGVFQLRSYMWPDCGDVDEMAVQRAVNGDPPDTLTRQERREAVRVLRRRGLSYSGIARRLGTHQRQIHRDLRALGLVGSSVGFPVEQEAG